jgi:nucleotide-binding universal stress UspA family protein
MIVIGTHGFKGLEKVLFGSVAEKVTKTAPCPVVTINPYQ